MEWHDLVRKIGFNPKEATLDQMDVLVSSHKAVLRRKMQQSSSKVSHPIGWQCGFNTKDDYGYSWVWFELTPCGKMPSEEIERHIEEVFSELKCHIKEEEKNG